MLWFCAVCLCYLQFCPHFLSSSEPSSGLLGVRVLLRWYSMVSQCFFPGEKGASGERKMAVLTRGDVKRRSASPGSFRIRRAVQLVGGPTLPRVVRTLLPEAQEPCRVHTTPISLGIPTRRRYGIRP